MEERERKHGLFAFLTAATVAVVAIGVVVRNRRQTERPSVDWLGICDDAARVLDERVHGLSPEDPVRC